MRISPFAVAAAAIFCIGLGFAGKSYFRQSEVANQATARREDQKKLTEGGLEIARVFDSQINQLVQEGAYCVPRCRMAYRPPWPAQKGNEHFYNSWEMVSETAAMRVLSFPELDAEGKPQFRLLISYGTQRADGDLRAADPKFADFLAKLMQRLGFPPAYVNGACIGQAAEGRSVYSCKQDRFWWGDFAFDPLAHPSVKTLTTERTITLIRRGPFEEAGHG